MPREQGCREQASRDALGAGEQGCREQASRDAGRIEGLYCHQLQRVVALLGRNGKQSHCMLSNSSGSCSYPLGMLLLWKILAFLCHALTSTTTRKMQEHEEFLLLFLPTLVHPDKFQSMHLQPPWLSSNVGQSDKLQEAKAHTKPDARGAEAVLWLTWHFGRSQKLIFQ